VPRVSPYPETPDGVFPGTPCYRVAAGGKYVYVFVLDPASVGYPEEWDGKYKQQRASYWIVPHFIYRDANKVEELKKSGRRSTTTRQRKMRNRQAKPITPARVTEAMKITNRITHGAKITPMMMPHK
jgi:hypothetical protein